MNAYAITSKYAVFVLMHEEYFSDDEFKELCSKAPKTFGIYRENCPFLIKEYLTKHHGFECIHLSACAFVREDNIF